MNRKYFLTATFLFFSLYFSGCKQTIIQNPEPDTIAPASVKNLTLVSSKATLATIAWESPSDKDLQGFKVSVYQDEVYLPQYTVSLEKTAKNYTIHSLESESTYTVKVFAFDKSFNYSKAAVISVTTYPQNPDSPNEPDNTNEEIHLISDCNQILYFIQNKTANGYDLLSQQDLLLPSGTTVNDIEHTIPGFTIDFISQIGDKAYAFYSRNNITVTFKNSQDSYSVTGLYETLIPDYHYNNKTITFPAEDTTYSQNWHKISSINLCFITNYGTSPEPMHINCCNDSSKIGLPAADQVLNNEQKSQLTIGSLKWIDQNDTEFIIPSQITSNKSIELRASWSVPVNKIDNSAVFINDRNLVLPYGIWISNHEVTQKEYTQIMQNNPSFYSTDPVNNEIQENRPVERISFFDAILYCNKRSISENLQPCYSINGTTNPELWGQIPANESQESFSDWCNVTCNFTANGYRLLTEAEWEYAARGSQPNNYEYSGSSTPEGIAWYSVNSSGKTHQVCKKQPNNLGLYDMTGNVLEWCWDNYNIVTADTPFSGNPTALEKNGIPTKISRGGSCGANNTYIKIQTRNQSPINDNSQYVGMRVCRTIATTPEKN